MAGNNGVTDVAIVGGGIAGSALALVLAQQGLGVTVLEHQAEYRDRVRGEWMAPWGLSEAQDMGIADALREAGGVVPRRSIPYDENLPPEQAELGARDYDQLLPGVPGPYCAGHPASCRALSAAAEAAGARYRRGIGATRVTAGPRPVVAYDLDGTRHEIAARLVVGADGRTSATRAQVGIPMREAAMPHLIAGLLVDNVPSWPQDVFTLGTEGETMFYVFPQGGQRARLYTCIAPDQRERYAGPEGAERFRDDFRRLTALRHAAELADGKPIGPCATIGGEDTWTEVPFVAGVALIGDAAGYNNPIIGQGLSLAMRDARVLSELLLSDSRWMPERLTPYAEERSERLRRLRFTAGLFAEVYTTFGPEGAARRGRVFGRLQDPRDPAQMLYAPVLVGPHRCPDWAFTEEFRTRLLH